MADCEAMRIHSNGELTPIELRAARLIAIGRSTREIAWALGIADHEVAQLSESIRRKTGFADPMDVWCAVSGCEPWRQDAA